MDAAVVAELLGQLVPLRAAAHLVDDHQDATPPISNRHGAEHSGPDRTLNAKTQLN
jgi:hypothetical protein